MKKILILYMSLLGLYACDNTVKDEDYQDPKKVNWSERVAQVSASDSLVQGQSYISIYSQIYSFSHHKTYNLTAMASLRNTSMHDTIYLSKADYYDTHGTLLKSYIKTTVYLAPLETVEIVINETDISGGTGSNFLFDWQTPQNCPEPIFEGVMTSTAGQQGLSFTTQSKRLH
ncbi:uncharacterized protein DUF3124 [Winogradskyella epiphytica]|uniref:Uncharacterized protein DUF3124 n=1 Tax=Winogradskyella epiphytica TaxID=262005 RepID=A0A2V4XW99_9FLAO|nr:DUF3124 domain-containing protein [Winogradskyella epiphytica]PYE79599.1 uncharacterized protein DUF3124 [Winogradskyella epiphytica]GGW74048.1 hypothetical protein GCM10008085_27810 [Winogradskyella epiphytica]